MGDVFDEIEKDAPKTASAAIKPRAEGDVFDQIEKEQGKSASTKGSTAPGESSVGKDLLTGIAQGAANTTGNLLSGTARLIHKIPVVGETLAPEVGIRAIEARTAERSKPENTAQAVGKTGEQIGEWLLPSGAEEKAVSLLPNAARAVRGIVPAVRIGTQAIESGLRNKSQGGEFGTGAEMGGVGGVVGEGMRAVAPAVAESALGVTNRMRGHGRTVGDAILNETSGVRASTIGKQAGAKLGGLTSGMEAGVHDATAAGAMGSTDAAHDVLDNALTKAPRNAKSYRDKLSSLKDLLHFGDANQRDFSPDELLEMKRGIDKEINSWQPSEKKTVEPIKHKIYRAIDGEIDKLVPGNAEANQKISSLIPVQKRTNQILNNAPMAQRVAHRLAAHTGALTGATAGGILGYQHGGFPEAVGGAITGLAVPEILASTPGQMFAARRLASPGVPLNLLKGSILQAFRDSEENNQPKEK